MSIQKKASAHMPKSIHTETEKGHALNNSEHVNMGEHRNATIERRQGKHWQTHGKTETKSNVQQQRLQQHTETQKYSRPQVNSENSQNRQGNSGDKNESYNRRRRHKDTAIRKDIDKDDQTKKTNKTTNKQR